MESGEFAQEIRENLWELSRLCELTTLSKSVGKHTIVQVMIVQIKLNVRINQGSHYPGSTLIVYREGDIVKQPMKKGSFVPKNVPRVGWGGVCHVGVGWGGVGHARGWGVSCRVGWGGGWGVSCRGGMGWVM